jgi:hypothetical protein
MLGQSRPRPQRIPPKQRKFFAPEAPFSRTAHRRLETAISPRPSFNRRQLLLEGADAHGEGIGADHISLLAIASDEDVPVRSAARLAFENHCSSAVGVQSVGALQDFALGDVIAQ